MCGLPVTDLSFSMLPPHFSLTDLSELEGYGWNNILDSYDSFPMCFKKVIPMLLASIIYHMAWLKSNLSKKHPLWNSRLMTSMVNGESHIVPFRKLYQANKQRDLRTRENVTLLTRTHLCMTMMESIGRSRNIIAEHADIGAMSTVESDDIYKQLYPLFMNTLYPESRHYIEHQTTYSTLANRIYNLKLHKA